MKKKNQLLLIFAMGLLAGPIVALAQSDYDIELVDHPGAPVTQMFGINDRGDAAGIGIVSPGNLLPFVYAQKKGTFTDVAPLASFPTAVLGISDSGVLVGNVDSLDLLTTTGFIRDKNGNFTVFSHPDAVSFTTARGVNNQGLVTAIYNRPDPIFGTTLVGFIYDSKGDKFTDIIPPGDHLQSIAQGINSKGEMVGSAFFFSSSDPCNTNSPTFLVRYGWHRATDGTVTYFSVNGWQTAARGINDPGTVVGFVFDPNDGRRKGFVVELDGSQCQAITVAASDLLEKAGFANIFPGGINNSGVISGTLRNAPGTNRGFIARPE